MKRTTKGRPFNATFCISNKHEKWADAESSPQITARHFAFDFGDIAVEGYDPHPGIKAAVAI